MSCSTGSFSVGGTVSGLAGSGLVLRNNGGDDLQIASNGSFTFATELASGGTFEVTVATQPGQPSQTCTVADGTGTVGAGDVRTVKVSCATNTFTIRGTVSGLQGSGLVLQNNGGDDVGVQSDGGFAFATKIPSGSQYSVAVKTQPRVRRRRARCRTARAPSRISDVEDVTITCVLRSSRSAARSATEGHGAGAREQRQRHGLADRGRPVYVPDRCDQRAAVQCDGANPPLRPLQLCRVTNGTASSADANITNIAIQCVATRLRCRRHCLGAEAPGLELQSNGEKLQIAANGKFLVPARCRTEHRMTSRSASSPRIRFAASATDAACSKSRTLQT